LENKQQNKVTKSSNVWLKFSSLGLQMGLTIYFCHLLGAWLDKNHNVPILAASMEGDIITKSKFSDEGILIIGNEGKGISQEILEKSDRKITIPRIGAAESLNAAVATSILLYQLKAKS
jgi:tRNA G18 (ribose-2'-O)-methylase SpoU